MSPGNADFLLHSRVSLVTHDPGGSRTTARQDVCPRNQTAVAEDLREAEVQAGKQGKQAPDPVLAGLSSLALEALLTDSMPRKGML